MNKKAKRTMLAIIIIVLVIGSFYAYRKLNLIIQEDIIVDVKDNYNSVWLNYGDRHEFDVTAEINNYWLCNAVCEQNIIDVRSGKHLLNETFYVKNNKKESVTATITPHKGYGQSLYQYEIKCKNIPTNNCPTGEGLYIRKSTLVVNHEPNDLQKELINQAIYLFNNISYNIAYSELNIDNTTNILYNLDINFPKSLKDDALSYNVIAQDLRDSEKRIIADWKDDEYESAHEKISEIYSSSNELFNSTSTLLNTVNDLVHTHNTIVRMHKNSLVNAQKIIEMLKYYPGEIAEFRNDAITSLSLVNINTIKMNKLENYDSLLREAQLEKENINFTISLFDSKIIETKSDYVDIYLADSLACIVLGCNNTNINYSLKSIDDIKYRCILYDEIASKFFTAQNITKTNRRGYNGSLESFDIRENRHMTSLLNDLQFNDGAMNARINQYILLLNNSNNDPNIVFINDASISGMYYSLEFQPMINALNRIVSYCNRSGQNFSFDGYIIQEQILPELTQQPDIKKISQPIHKCCLYGKCTGCGSDKKNPLILLHGHSFNQKNSAYQSTDIFNHLEYRLADERYVALGIWKPYANPKNTIFTNALFKPTYYITTYIDILGTNTIESKDESIEEYSERLKGTIDNIKMITGRDKVDIVAHSMGGLVTRRYIQKYGPNDIDNLILIGTSNNGISDRVYNACKFFGNEKECDEMHQGSEFLKLVNQNYPMPKTSLIIGKGCDMQGVDGDGVVTVDNAKLDNYKIFYVQGNCTGQSFLHNDMLNKQEVVNRIESILN